MDEDLGAILRTIREVEDSLERRSARAEGSLLMIWGVVGASIFAFYQLVELNAAPYHDALGAWLSWVWLFPMALGYVASGILGARLGRMGADAERQRAFRRGAIPGLLVTALVVALILTQRYGSIYGGVTLLSGLAVALFSIASPSGVVRTSARVLSGLMCVAGVALLVAWSWTWASGAAALAFLVCYLTLGTVKYRLGR